MKSLILILSIFAFLSLPKVHGQCNSTLQDVCVGKIKGTTYLKDFKVKLQKASSGKKQPIAKYSLALSKGNHYRFTVCNDKYKDSKAIIQIYQGNKLVGSNFNKSNKKIYPAFDFLCNRTGVYSIYISYNDGMEGCSVTMLSLVK